MIYEKATAEVILFDNSDVIRTSSAGGSCRTPGHDNGHGCGNTSGTCTTKHAWKSGENGLDAWRANRAGL